MTKIPLEQKITLLDAYIQRPHGLKDGPILKAIKTDVVKANTKGVRKGSDLTPGPSPSQGEGSDNTLYNACMGVYRAFLKSRDSHLDMSGKKAAMNSRAMRQIMQYIRDFARNNGRPHDDDAVLKGVRFVFDHWNRLSEFHQRRLALPDIYDKIEEIIPQIKKGHDKRTNEKSAIEQRQLELAQQAQRRAGEGR